MKPSERMLVHVRALGALVDRLDPGDAHDRIQAQYEGAQADYKLLKRKEDRDDRSKPPRSS